MPKAEAKYTLRAEDETEGGLRSARRRLTDFGARAASRLARPLSLAAGAVAAIGTAAIKAASDLDRLAKQADNLGASVTEVAELDLAAQLGGTDLEQVASVLGRVARAAQGAEDNLTSYVRIFNRLRIDTGKFLDLDIEDQAVALARGLADLEEREGAGVRRATQRELGIRRASFLRDPAELRRQFAEARRLGITEGIEEEARDAVELTDAWTRFKAVAGNFLRDTALLPAPALTAGFNRAATAIASFRGQGQAGPIAPATTAANNATENTAAKQLAELKTMNQYLRAAGRWGP